nr:hypothetical protein [Tanacetum cinerariifolium]
MVYLVKISKKVHILELKRRHLKIVVLTSYTPYPSRKIRRICAYTSQETTKIQSPIRRIQETYIRRIQYKVIKYSGRCRTTKTYKDYENKLNDELEEPWSEDEVPYEIYDHVCEPFRFKNGKAKWPTCKSNEDGFCNGGELPGMVRVGYMTYFQDYEWYNELADKNLKEEAFKQKDINMAYSLHTIQRIECLDVISPLFSAFKTLSSDLSIWRIHAHDTVYLAD